MRVVVVFLALLASASAFLTRSNRPASFRLAAQEESSFPVFTGGILDKKEAEAVKLASRIKSVKDLGWTKPAKRRGATRPRHRAYGGQDEDPIQLKANYDETNPRCVEKWLTQEEFNSKLKTGGAVSDTVFVALAGGAAYAEREICEEKINQWRPSGKFNEAAFLKTVQQGRLELAVGWTVFLSISGFCVAGLAFPNNPGMKALVDFLEPIQQEYAASLV